MILNIINLDISQKRLTGFDNGLHIYKTQIVKKLNRNMINAIIFPNHVEMVSYTFVQGLFSELIDMIGYDTFRNMILIYGPDDVVRAVYNRIY